MMPFLKGLQSLTAVSQGQGQSPSPGLHGQEGPASSKHGDSRSLFHPSPAWRHRRKPPSGCPAPGHLPHTGPPAREERAASGPGPSQEQLGWNPQWFCLFTALVFVNDAMCDKCYRFPAYTDDIKFLLKIHTFHKKTKPNRQVCSKRTTEGGVWWATLCGQQ